MARTLRSSSNSEHQGRFFTHTGFHDQNPNGTKKDGAGRFNWGSIDDEIAMVEESGEYNFAHQRKRTNSSMSANRPLVSPLESAD